MDNQGVLYVSDCERHEICRYEPLDEREGVIVAGLNQLNDPRNIYVDVDDDDHKSMYVSDIGNHRVVKWMENAREGVLINAMIE